MNIRRTFDNIKRWVVQRFMPEREQSRKLQPRAEGPTVRIHHAGVESSRSSKNSLVKWCRSFNRRNGHVTPDVSVESIARRAVHFRKRRK